MSTSFVNNENIDTSNTILLNNYSIQNNLTSPSNFYNYYKIPINTGDYFQEKQIQTQTSFSPIYRNSNVKKVVNINIPSNNKYKISTPMPSKRISTKFRHLKKEKVNNYKMPIDMIPKMIPIYKRSKFEERHPRDSIKKNLIKKKNVLERNISAKKSLKNSLSQGFYEPLKSQKSSLNNYSMEHYNKLKGLISGPRNNLSRKKSPRNSKNNNIEPKNNINLKEFQFGEQIGKGTFGNIFSVKWNENNKYYAMKKEILNNKEDIQNRKKSFKIIGDFIKNTECKGVIKLYGNLCLKYNKIKDNNIISDFIYYELMEQAERDWDNEINERSAKENYYSEKEILDIMTQLIGTLSLLQKNHITHRDIKPQNILIFNGKYKLCDFGEIRILERAGLIVQRIRGSELYMSPILFKALHLKWAQVKHNTYKSDVFSLGMCLFYACSLTYNGVDSIRELTDMKKIREILFHYLSKRYSHKLISFILSMLEIDENKRQNFIQLEEKLNLLL